MSIGNLKDYGNKGNNFPYQLRSLKALAAINKSIIEAGGGGADNAMIRDSFGRLRVSNPLTLFDSSHRYKTFLSI